MLCRLCAGWGGWRVKATIPEKNETLVFLFSRQIFETISFLSLGVFSNTRLWISCCVSSDSETNTTENINNRY